MSLSKKNQIKNYYNRDSFTVKKSFVENQLFFIENLPLLNILTQKQWILFDEIHKFKQWKNILKGYYDEFKDFLNFIVCGSARLDILRKTGESLLGRYFLFRMFPLGANDIVYGESFKIENVYLIFQIPPYSERIQRSIKKEKKIYFWDWGTIEDKGKKFTLFSQKIKS